MTSVSNVRKLATRHATVPIPNVLTVTTMDMLPQTTLIKYHLQAHQHAVETTPPTGMIDPHLGSIAPPGIPTVIIGIDTGSVVPDPTHKTLDTGVTAAMTACRSCSRLFHRPSHCSSPSHRSSSSYCYCCNTPHRRSSSHRNFS